MTLPKFPLEIDIVHVDEKWPKTLEGSSIDSVVKLAINQALLNSKAIIHGPCELCIVLSNDQEQQQLNNKWRQKDSATNVLSFPQINGFSPLSGLLGDIVLARQTIEHEAKDQNKSMRDHLIHLVVHGFLHILGYDHQNDTQAKQMESLETDILDQLKIDDPYSH